MNRRNRNIFAKKAPKTRKSILIALGLGILTGAGYVIMEKIAEHNKERAAIIAEAREQMRGGDQFSVDQTVKEESSDTLPDTIDL